MKKILVATIFLCFSSILLRAQVPPQRTSDPAPVRPAATISLPVKSGGAMGTAATRADAVSRIPADGFKQPGFAQSGSAQPGSAQSGSLQRAPLKTGGSQSTGNASRNMSPATVPLKQESGQKH